MPSRNITTTVLILLYFYSATTCASDRNLRIATWNLNNLHYVAGEPLRSHAPSRSKSDYDILNEYVRRIHADVIAFQEVNGPEAARIIFSDNDYRIFVSGRYTADLASGNNSDHIYIGFAVRRGVFDAVNASDYSDLSISHGIGQRPTRWGLELVVRRNGRKLHFMNVHLKSGCFRGRLENPTSPNCVTLANQRQPLEEWIDRNAGQGDPFIILGDFNRAFDVFQNRDHLWAEIDDGNPPGLDLWRLPYEQESKCWKGTENYHKNPVDFFVFDQRAWDLVMPNSFVELTYDESHQNPDARTPSDHCPIIVELRF